MPIHTVARARTDNSRAAPARSTAYITPASPQRAPTAARVRCLSPGMTRSSCCRSCVAATRRSRLARAAAAPTCGTPPRPPRRAPSPAPVLALRPAARARGQTGRPRNGRAWSAPGSVRRPARAARARPRGDRRRAPPCRARPDERNNRGVRRPGPHDRGPAPARTSSTISGTVIRCRPYPGRRLRDSRLL